MKTEWIYFFEEPVRHQGLIEIGRTGRTVEDRNRDKRSVDPWLEISRYPVVDSRKAEHEIIKATVQHRYKKRKEILQIDWPTLEGIVEPILKKNEQFQVMIDNMMEQWFKEWKQDMALNNELTDKIYDYVEKPYRDGLERINSRFERECKKYGIDPDVFQQRTDGDLGDKLLNNPAGFILTGGLFGMLTVGPLLNWASTKMREQKLRVAKEALGFAIKDRNADILDLEKQRDKRQKLCDEEQEIRAVDQYLWTCDFVGKSKKIAGAPMDKITEKEKIEAAINWKNQRIRNSMYAGPYWSRGNLTADDYISIKKSRHS